MAASRALIVRGETNVDAERLSTLLIRVGVGVGVEIKVGVEVGAEVGVKVGARRALLLGHGRRVGRARAEGVGHAPRVEVVEGHAEHGELHRGLAQLRVGGGRARPVDRDDAVALDRRRQRRACELGERVRRAEVDEDARAVLVHRAHLRRHATARRRARRSREQLGRLRRAARVRARARGRRVDLGGGWLEGGGRRAHARTEALRRGGLLARELERGLEVERAARVECGQLGARLRGDEAGREPRLLEDVEGTHADGRGRQLGMQLREGRGLGRGLAGVVLARVEHARDGRRVARHRGHLCGGGVGGADGEAERRPVHRGLLVHVRVLRAVGGEERRDAAALGRASDGRRAEVGHVAARRLVGAIGQRQPPGRRRA
eukprot:scaffold17672_cov65-Phaeocystis_antarctica.AAC.1